MLLRQTLSFLPAQLIGPLAQFVAVIAWTHWLPPATYGLIALIMAAQELVYQLSLSWWTQYTMRYLAALREEERRADYQPLENAVMLASIPVQLLILTVMLAWTGHMEPGLLAVTAAYTVTRSLGSQLAEDARSRGEVVSYTIAQTMGPVLGFLLGWALMALRCPDAVAVIGGFAVAQTLALPVLAVRLRLGWRAGFNRAGLKAAIAFGLPLLVSGGIGWVSINGIRVVVDYEQGAAAVGLLSVGWGLGQRLSWVVSMLVTAASFPLAVRRLAQQGRVGALAQVADNGTLLAAIMLPATVGVICVTQPMVEAIVGRAFWDATIAILPIAMVAAAIRNLRAHWADQVFYLTEEPHVLLAVNTGEALAAVLLCWLGLRWGGLAGACLGCLVASAGAAMFCFGLAIGRHGLRLQPGPLAKIAAATACMAMLVSRDWYPAGLGGLALRIGAGACLYLALIALLFRERLPAFRLLRAGS